MNNRKIRSGELVEISPVEKNAKSKSYICKVEMSENDTVLIHSPYENLQYVRLPATGQFWLHSMRGMFRYKAAIGRRSSVNGYLLIEFKLIGEPESLQQRKHYRLSCHVPIKFTLSERDESYQCVTCGSFDGITSNISGGGLKMTTDIEMKENETILISMHLDDDFLLLVGEIRAKYSDNAPYQFQYGVRFNGISDTDQDTIVRYIFRQQNRRIRVHSTV